jgi:2-oxoglutarate dehydrogenase E1 component
MEPVSFISNATPDYIESLYETYKREPDAIDQELKKFFEGFDFAVSTWKEDQTAVSPKELQVFYFIEEFRRKGHLLSNTNPIRPRLDRKPNLDLEYFGLTQDDLKQSFIAGKVLLGLSNPTLENIVAHLRKIYCGSIGIEYHYMVKAEDRKWVQEEFEKRFSNLSFPLEKKIRILEMLNKSAVFEKFLHTKYIGQKRFSLEGGESTIPALDSIINKAAELGVEEVVIGMAHRGRLNVLANIMGKTYEHIFNEFEGNIVPDLTMGDGDVKYHMGFSSLIETVTGKKINVKLSPNPSHLESVNPVVEGFARAKADILYNSDYSKVMPILIHGDAALPGQGVSYEVIQMSQLKGYDTGGTIHFVINNQIGFTTDFEDARSSIYCTSMASMVNAPVLHVNGDDVEAVVFAVEFATEFRCRFKRDIFVDMVCYRKYGHNESDEPKFTQPSLYKLIEKHPSPREVYVKKLYEDGSVDRQLVEQLDKQFWQLLQERLDEVKQKSLPYVYQEPELAWKSLRKSTPEDFEYSPETAISKRAFDTINQALLKVPDDFTPLKQVKRLLEANAKRYKEGKLDWAMAELLAYGSILLEGKDVRMSGQDVKRGTFSHRHAVLSDELNDRQYNRLNHIAEKQGQFRIFNSLLSEFAVLGFEFGYSWASPNSLVIWEAQFGDFANGAQTIIDQFISSGESKWQRMSGLVMLLPHGYEGQGPEHSSARLERFLQLSAEYNMVVVNLTTPANFFHALRRQLAWPFRKPLVVMSPKSLLRHPECISDASEFINGKFREIIDDAQASKNANKIKRVLLCSGKIYYDLLDKQRKDGRNDVAIVRIEQLYPLAQKQFETVLQQYKKAELYWVQEEPANMGAWTYLLSHYCGKLNLKLVARKASASPATGYSKAHIKEQADIVEQAFNETLK